MFKIDERLPKESAKDYVVRQLVYNIVHINLTPGQQLDSDEISELLNVSKNPIREAELELSQTRLIEIKPKIGAYVSLIDANIVEEVRELRSVLEAELAALACTTLFYVLFYYSCPALTNRLSCIITLSPTSIPLS